MSYIDCFDHEHVGFFSGYPLYRPLEKFEPDDTLDGQFSCHENNIIIGGGYLEHPGLVIRDLDYVAAEFINTSRTPTIKTENFDGCPVNCLQLTVSSRTY